MTKHYLKSLIIFYVMLIGLAFPNNSSATSGSYTNGGVAGGVITIPDVNIPNIIGGPSHVAAKMCEIRKLFCGEAFIVFVALAILLMGIMILNHKLHWGSAIVIIVGIGIFLNAHWFVQLFAQNYDPNTLLAVCKC